MQITYVSTVGWDVLSFHWFGTLWFRDIFMYYELELCIELESKYGYIFKQKKEKSNIKATKIPCNLSIITWNWICKCILIRP